MRSIPAGLLLAFAAASNLAMTGCGRTWPSVRPQIAPEFQRGQAPIQRIDVLPIDVEVLTYAGARPAGEELEVLFEEYAQASVLQALLDRGYDVGGLLDWSGAYAALGGQVGQAMEPRQVLATADALAALGSAQAALPGQLLDARLPAALGEATGADATLYVGGWAYAGKDHHGIRGRDIAAGVFIALFIVVVVVIVAAALRSNGGGGSLGKAAGNAGGAASNAASSAGRGFTRGAGRLAGGMRPAGRSVARGAARGLDALGRAPSLDIRVSTPELSPDPGATSGAGWRGGPAEQRRDPRPGRNAPSRMMIDMVLVDNATGRTLWRASQEFRASPARPQDTAEVMTRLLRTLPAQASSTRVVAR